MGDYRKYDCLYEVEKVFEWDKWRKEIPYINWPSSWEVRAVPAFHTGIIRYNVRHIKNEKVWVSIYLDAYDRAGFYDRKPYWEVYPADVEGDCLRFDMIDTDGLLKAIKASFKKQLKDKRNEKNQT